MYDPQLGRDIGVRYQFPLKLAYGLSIHKSQGMTLDDIVVDCKLMEFPGLLCVAIGRVTSSQGLHLIDFTEKAILKPNEVDRTLYQEKETHPLHEDLQCCRRATTKSDEEKTIQIQPEVEDLENLIEQITLNDNLSHFNDESKNAAAEIAPNIFTDDVSFPLLILPSDPVITDQIECTKIKEPLSDAHNSHNNSIDTLISSPNFGHVTQILYSYLHHLHRKIIKKLPCGSGSYNDKVIDLTQSESFNYIGELIYNKCDENDEYNIWNLIMTVSAMVEEERVKENEQQKTNQPERCNESRLKNHHERAKIRYIAGYTIASVRSKYLKGLEALELNTLKKIQEWERKESFLHVMSFLTSEDSVLMNESNDKESLEETIKKQFPGGHLTHVTDEFYAYFENLTMEGIKLMGNDCVKLHGSKAPEKVTKQLMQNVEVKQLLMEIYSTRNLSSEATALVENIHTEIVKKLCNVLTRQWATDIVQKQAKITKKRAHRVEVLIPSKKQKVDQARIKVPQHLRKLLKPDLVKIASSLSLSTNGTKENLIDRISSSDAEIDHNSLLENLSDRGKKVLAL